jgi:hypothetical protein
MEKIECQNCKNWKQTDLITKYGKCSYYDIFTECYAGVKYQTPKKIKYCIGFKEK